MHSITSVSDCQRILDSKPQVMLKFSAEWCAPCKAAAPVIEKMAPQFPDIFMAEVDIDKSQDLASMYSVSAVPSFVFFHNKIEVGRVRGADIAKVTAALRSLAAKTPSFGKGHRVGSPQGAGIVPAARPAPNAAEIRAARTRALEKKLYADPSSAPQDEKKGVQSRVHRALQPPGSQTPTAKGQSVSIFHSIFQYLMLYILTLFSLDSRARALSLNRKQD